jgi:hypothetical protein
LAVGLVSRIWNRLTKVTSSGLALLPFGTALDKSTGPKMGASTLSYAVEWSFARGFATYKEAEMEADIFAKDWVDSNRTVTLGVKK